MKVADVLVRKSAASEGAEVRTVHPWTVVGDAVRLLAGPPTIGALVVCDDAGQHVAGLLTERDIVRALYKGGASMLTAHVADVLTQHRVATCGSGDSVTELMKTMTRYRQRHVPVVDDGDLRGLVSIGDVVAHRLAEMQLENDVLRDIYATRH
jgi:CBS domain-containing protein